MLAPRIYASPYPSASVRSDESFWQFILRLNIDDTLPDKVILQEHERPEQFLTYGSATKVAGLGAAGLHDVLGLSKGNTILIIGKNSLDWLQLEFAALWAGIKAAFGNPLATAQELVHFIDIVDPDVIFCDPGDIMSKVAKALGMRKDSCETRPAIIGLGEPGDALLAFPRDFVTETGESHPPPLDLSKGDNRKFPAVICFSSGTSGLPKAAILSHHNLIAYLLGARATDPTIANSEQRDVFYAPLGHIYGIFMSSLPLFTGGYVRLLRNYNIHEYVKACVEIRATTLRVVPPTVVAMVKDPFVRQQDLASVRTISCAGAVLAPDIITELRQMMGEVELIQGYGMTEGGITSLRRFSARLKQGSVGRLMANVQLRIVDDNLQDVPEGKSGEVIFSSPTVFMGYKNNEEANAEAFPYKDGWMRTGDVGRMDGDGYLWLTDRKKDLIKYKGNQVTPAELENVLLSHPEVTEAGVCATWDRNLETEVPVGYVNFKPAITVADHEGLLKEVLGYVNERVSRSKKLRGGLFFLETFPRNPTGKLLRRNLPARLRMRDSKI
ncbi:Fc.00g058730.m01.CDS01 [Cosmosporella sp. VM-42]